MKTRAFIFLAAISLALHQAAARPMVGLTGANQLVTFDSATPGTLSAPIAITGLVAGDSIHAIDFRPRNGLLYGLAINNPDGNPDTGRIYIINVSTGAATQVGTTPFSTTLSNNNAYGFDFNPSADVIRVTSSNDESLRVNADTGNLLAVDSPLSDASQNETIVGIAYDRNDRNPNTSTTLFGINFSTDELVRIGGVNGSPSPNLGVVTPIGGLGITTFNTNIGFDIAEDGVAYLSTPVGGVYRLYTVNLASGTAALLGTLGPGSTLIRDVTASPSLVANIDSGEFFSTIQAAVSDAQTITGHTIVVNAGTFNEQVTIPPAKGNLTLLGARSGIPGNTLGRGTNESVVRGGAGATRPSAFRIQANNVVIDGFAVQDTNDGNNLGGIAMIPNLSGCQIRNNLIQNNIVGLIPSNNAESNPLIIRDNLFLSNNQTGPVGGTAIYTDQFTAGSLLTNVVIDNNRFADNDNTGVLLGATTTGAQRSIAITNNIMESNGNAVLVFNTSNGFITGNAISSSLGSQIVIGGGVDGIDISENFIASGNSRGIRIGNFGGGGTNTNVVVSCNFIASNPTAGIEIDSTANSYTGTLSARHNFWGTGTGPTIGSNPSGSGDKIVDPNIQIFYAPFKPGGVDEQVNAAGFQCYPAPILYGINTGNNLIRFAADNPGSFTSIPITGMIAGDTIVGLDFRPGNGQLYGLGSGNRLYVINPASGAAVQVGTDGAFVLNGTAFGFDFHPVSDRIRVVSDTNQDIRLNPTDGTLTGTDIQLFYPPGDPRNGFQPDAVASAYSNSYGGATRTTLYHIDSMWNSLVHQGPILGASTASDPGELYTMGQLGINPDDASKANTAFDIFSPIAGINRPYAAVNTGGGFSVLYGVNLISGATGFIGTVGFSSPGLTLARGLAAAPVGLFNFSAINYGVGESGPVALITINRLGGSEGSVDVTFTTTDGTAVGGSDYTDSDQIVTFGPGEISKVVQIPIANDNADEANKTVFLRLTDATNGGFIGNQSAATLTINDDDVATPALSAQSSSTAAVGETIFDVATISSASSTPLGGTLTFQVFGPNDNSCGNAPVFTSVVQVNGNGNYASASFTPTTPGTYRWVVTYSGDVDHNAMVSTGCNGANQAFDATATVLGNIATRLRVETGDNALIAGFIITGTQPKKIIIRGIGTSLPIPDKLADPYLELRNSIGAIMDFNDNWVSSFDKQAIIDSTIPPSNDAESAIVGTLEANNSAYTTILRGANDGTGIGVVEVYDLNRLVDSQLANISTRGFVSTGDNVLIAGTIVVGKNPRNVIVRAIGPSLSLPNKMADPTLELRNGNGDLIEANDNWVDSPNKQAIINSTIPPSNDFESAIVATLPGNNAGYTAIVRGVNGTTGIAVVEIYALP